MGKVCIECWNTSRICNGQTPCKMCLLSLRATNCEYYESATDTAAPVHQKRHGNLPKRPTSALVLTGKTGNLDTSGATRTGVIETRARSRWVEVNKGGIHFSDNTSFHASTLSDLTQNDFKSELLQSLNRVTTEDVDSANDMDMSDDEFDRNIDTLSDSTIQFMIRVAKRCKETGRQPKLSVLIPQPKKRLTPTEHKKNRSY